MERFDRLEHRLSLQNGDLRGFIEFLMVTTMLELLTCKAPYDRAWPSLVTFSKTSLWKSIKVIGKVNFIGAGLDLMIHSLGGEEVFGRSTDGKTQ